METHNHKHAIIFLYDAAGRRLSYTFRLNTLRAVLASGGAFILLALTLMGAYVYTYQHNYRLKSHARTLSRTITTLEQLQKRAGDYKNWADTIIQKQFNFEDIAGKGSSSLAKNILDGPVEISPAKQSGLIDIDDFQIARINLALSFDCSFKLLNKAKRHISGYLFIIGRNTETIPETYATWPPAECISGMPADITDGSSFSIRYMKPVRGRISQPAIGPKFNQVDIVAYSDTGDLLFHKGFYIERMLQENPL
jgi:hypothetical protein